MEIVEILSNHIDKTQNLIIVEFRTSEDDDDRVREDFIEYSHYEEFGFDNKNVFEILSEYDQDDEWDNDDYDFITDDNNLLSFLNEYYIVYPNKLPKAQFR
jgi:hypothetical protein